MNKQKADQLITEYLPKVYGFAVTKAFSYDEAEELCADIICELYRSLLKSDEIYNTTDMFGESACMYIQNSFHQRKNIREFQSTE